MENDTIEKFIKNAGGTGHIAVKLGIHQINVDRWITQGIPWKHWEELIKKFGISANDLHEMNKKIRSMK